MTTVPPVNQLLIEAFGRQVAWRIDRLVIWLVLLPAVARAPLLFGLAYDLLGSYAWAITGLPLLPVAATTAVLLAKPPIPGEHGGAGK